MCKDCKHLKSKMSGVISTVYWCGISKSSRDTKLGVHPWMNKPHPKCPLKIVTESEVTTKGCSCPMCGKFTLYEDYISNDDGGGCMECMERFESEGWLL